jgi:hypothetical protein
VCRIDKTELGGPGLASGSVHGGNAAGANAGGNAPGLGRRDVQCEACHGPASEHVKDPPGHIVAKVGKSECLRCHEAANSPHFDYQKYLPGVVGPGHGAPLAAGQTPGPVWKAEGKP